MTKRSINVIMLVMLLSVLMCPLVFAVGGVLEVLINGEVVGTILEEDFVSTGELQLSDEFDISAYKNQTVSLALRLRQVGSGTSKVVIRDVSIVNVDLADLEPDSITYTSGIYKRGEEFSITVDIHNIGTFDKLSSQSCKINVVLSSDDKLNESDSILGAFNYGEFLPAEKNRIIQKNITIPLDFPVGLYYVGVVLDADESVAELNEDNNIFISDMANVGISEEIFEKENLQHSIKAVSKPEINSYWSDEGDKNSKSGQIISVLLRDREGHLVE